MNNDRQLWFVFVVASPILTLQNKFLPVTPGTNAVSNSVFRIRIIFFRIRIQRLRLETNSDPDTDPDPIRIQGFNDQKLKKNNSRKKN
jgi:hypothetical protein